MKFKNDVRAELKYIRALLIGIVEKLDAPEYDYEPDAINEADEDIQCGECSACDLCAEELEELNDLQNVKKRLSELDGRINHLAIRAQGRAKDLNEIRERLDAIEKIIDLDDAQKIGQTIDKRLGELEVCSLGTSLMVDYTLDKDAKIPTRAHPCDAGLDLYANEEADCINETFTIDTGVHIELPAGYVGLICPRSGMAREGRAPFLGVIDAGYTGSIKVCFRTDDFRSAGSKPLIGMPKKGDRIAQLIILALPIVELVSAKTLSETARGANGFGSSGR